MDGRFFSPEGEQNEGQEKAEESKRKGNDPLDGSIHQTRGKRRQIELSWEGYSTLALKSIGIKGRPRIFPRGVQRTFLRSEIAEPILPTSPSLCVVGKADWRRGACVLPPPTVPERRTGRETEQGNTSLLPI